MKIYLALHEEAQSKNLLIFPSCIIVCIIKFTIQKWKNEIWSLEKADCLMTDRNCLMIVWQLPYGCLTTASWFCELPRGFSSIIAIQKFKKVWINRLTNLKSLKNVNEIKFCGYFAAESRQKCAKVRSHNTTPEKVPHAPRTQMSFARTLHTCDFFGNSQFAIY